MDVLESSWSRVWKGLGAKGDGRVVAKELMARYSEPWRRYHTLQHLAECVAHFSSASHLANQPYEVEAGLWFHDAVYDLGAADNEDRSAHWARTALRGAGVEARAVERVSNLILATKHTAMPVLPDEQLLVDIDLSILGASPARFDEYEEQVRGEYAHVPEPAFRAGRSAVLRSFLERPSIYSTDHFHGVLNEAARSNLGRSLAALSG